MEKSSQSQATARKPKNLIWFSKKGRNRILTCAEVLKSPLLFVNIRLTVMIDTRMKSLHKCYSMETPKFGFSFKKG